MTMQTISFLARQQWLNDIWFKPGNSNLAPDTDGLFIFIMWVNIISFIALMIPMVYWVIRWRRKPGVAPIRTPNHNTVLEVTWVVGPLIVVTFIFFWGFKGYMETQVVKGTAEKLVVKAMKWNWSIMYPNGAGSGESVFLDDLRPNFKEEVGARRGNANAPVFVVPAGVPLEIKLTSADVMHSFYIPDARVKMDAFPNRYTSMSVTMMDSDPTKSGTGPITGKKMVNGQLDGKKGRDHYIFCAEYCGDSHSEMAAILRVLPMEDYKKTIEEWADIDDVTAPIELGKIVYKSKGCIQCHSVDGTPGTGPSWKGFYGKDIPFSSVSSTVKFDLNTLDGWNGYIEESIKNPSARIHAGFANQMSIIQLSGKQVQGVMAYFRDLHGLATEADRAKPEPKKK